MQPNSQADSGFIPRKEFIRDQRATSTFSLLAISGSSCIRLYSFPSDVIAALRRLLDHFYLNAGFREDTSQNFCEFTLAQKPWNAPKSARTERILLDILAIIYRFGYTILSTIDYGRERDDRLAISFSRFLTTASPALPFAPAPIGSGSNISHQTGSHTERRMPFAISFVSQTIMRVINPPLNATPAILQAVRGSWPRGVLSEKKSDNAYEFRLKGYRWFHEDTFATDSLRHILSLLSSLDAHACSLAISLAINGRSRVKDLWIFTGPGTTDTDPYWPESPISQSGSMLDVRRSRRVSTPEPQEVGMIPNSLHRRAAASSQHPPPQANPSSQTFPHHVRPSIESNSIPPLATNFTPISPHAMSGNTMRPRTQIPTSVDFDIQNDEERGHIRTSLASAVPSSCENMTGIGSMARNRFTSNLTHAAVPDQLPDTDPPNENVVYSPPPPERHHRIQSTRSPSPQRRVSALRPVSTRSKTPPLLRSHSPPRDPRTSSLPPASRDISLSDGPPLLSPGIFRVRDSAYSANTVDTDTSFGVPFKWGGLGRPEGIENIEEVHEELSEEAMPRGPILPGAWAVAPKEERAEVFPRRAEPSKADEHMLHLEQRSPDKSLHDIDARISSPEVVNDQAVRKSEAGLIGVISPSRPAPSPIHPPSRDSFHKMKTSSSSDPPASPTKPSSRSGSGNGWVFVDRVGGKEHMTPTGSPTSQTHTERGRKRTTSAAADRASMSATAKAIVVIDPKNAQVRKESTGSGLRRLLSISRPGAKGADEVKSDPRLAAVRAKELASNQKDKSKLASPRQGRFRNRFARKSSSEPAPRPPERARIDLN